MENNNLMPDNTSTEEEIPNIEQFQVERSGPQDNFQPESEGINPDPDDEDEVTEDAEYSEDEVEYADGEGTLLNEEFSEDQDDQ